LTQCLTSLSRKSNKIILFNAYLILILKKKKIKRRKEKKKPAFAVNSHRLSDFNFVDDNRD